MHSLGLITGMDGASKLVKILGCVSEAVSRFIGMWDSKSSEMILILKVGITIWLARA